MSSSEILLKLSRGNVALVKSEGQRRLGVAASPKLLQPFQMRMTIWHPTGLKGSAAGRGRPFPIRRLRSSPPTVAVNRPRCCQRCCQKNGNQVRLSRLSIMCSALPELDDKRTRKPVIRFAVYGLRTHEKSVRIYLASAMH